MSRSVSQILARLERLEVLYRISNIINTTLETAEILAQLLREVVRITDATSGSIAMIDHKKGILNIESATNIPPKLWKSCKLELGVGVTGACAWTGQPIRLGDVMRDARYVRLKADIRSEMALPMMLGKKVIGVINVDSTRADAFSQEDEDLCMAVANQSAKVIETARLHDEVRRNAAQMEALFTVGQTLIRPGPVEQLLDRIVEEGRVLLRGRVCVLMEVTEDRLLTIRAISGASESWREKPPVHVDKSLVGQVVKKNMPLRVPDVRKNKRFRYADLAKQEGLSSLLAVPVSYQDEVLAVLCIYSDEIRRFRESSTNLLQLLANQGAIAIENARRTERLRTLEDSLRRSERFSLLGTLAAEIAHEIRNPITIINLLMHGIQEDAGANDRTRADLEIVTNKLGRINQIVEQTLNIARSTECVFAPANLNKLIEELLLFMNYKFEKARIEILAELDAKIGNIPMDSGQIQQVLLNLMMNAMQAMPDGGKLTIQTRQASDRALGACVRCKVIDTGSGISAEGREQLFEPFHTTRDGGTGLGLFVSDKLVKRHNGKLAVTSAPGKGSTFTVTLPLIQEGSES